jgi:heat shock protein HslJ
MLTTGAEILLFFVFAFPAAQATPTAPGPGIPPHVWQLVALTGTDGVAVAIDDPTRYTVQFLPEGRLAAKLDCNRGGAGFTAADGVLEVSVMATTLALCEPGSHGETFGRILQYATSYEIDADGYLWLRGDEGVLQLRPAFSAAPRQVAERTGRDERELAPAHAAPRVTTICSAI